MLTPGGVRYDRKTVSGRHVEFVYKPLADGGLLGVHRDITELKDREQAVEQARSLMQSVLDNMSDGVTLFDPDFRMKFTNQALVDFIKLPPEMTKPGVFLLDILRYQAKRGDFGPAENAEELARSRFEFIAKPGGAYFERRTAEGLHLEFRFVPLSNGDTIVVTRDITELKDREQALATSKEAAEAARDEVARTHQIMQMVFDNLIDGVSLFDKDFRWVFSNRQHREQHGYTPDAVQPGDSGYKLIRRLIDNGEYGPVDDIDAKVAEIAGRMRNPGGNHYERKTYDGRYIEYIFRELEDGGLLGRLSRHHRAPRTRGGARGRQGSGGSRARGGRSRNAGQVHLPRHHEPRDPHADERRARHDGGAGAPGPRRGAAQERGDHARLGAGAAAHHR